MSIDTYHVLKAPGTSQAYTSGDAIFETTYASGAIQPKLRGSLCQVTIAISGAAAALVLSAIKNYSAAAVSLMLKDGNPIDNSALQIFEFAWDDQQTWDFSLNGDCKIEHIVVREILNK